MHNGIPVQRIKVDIVLADMLLESVVLLKMFLGCVGISLNQSCLLDRNSSSVLFSLHQSSAGENGSFVLETCTEAA